MGVKLTDKGLKTVIASVIVFGFGLALRDFILIVVPVVFGLFLYTQQRDLLDSLGIFEEVVFTHSIVEETVTAGSRYIEPIQVYSPLTQPLNMVPGSSHESIEPSTIGTGEWEVSYFFSPILSGVHESGLDGRIQDKFRLFSATGKLGFRVFFNVYPRVFPIAVAVVQFLIGEKFFGEMETSKTMRGRGGDYAYTRRYEPGDPINVFDWKAYARTGKPMVKEYYDETGGGINIVYDPLVLDRISLDELNSEFLKTVLTYAQAKTPIRLYKLEKNRVIQVASNQMDALSVALKISLEFVIEDFFQYFAVLEPTRVDKVWKILGVRTPKPVNADPLKDEVIIVSSLHGNPAKILDIIRNMPRANTRIIQPTRKWLYTTDLNQSVRIYLDNEAKTKILEKVGIKTYQDIVEAEPWLIKTH
jgi:hypothetical protein